MNVVIKVNDEIKEKMIEYYKDKRRDKVIPYVVFQAEEEDTVITMYESGKVMFQGTSADVDAAMWGVQLENTKEKKEERKKADLKYYNCSAVGSDEVGTGDYFGPIVVTACYVSKNDIKFLEELGVGDSKKIDDAKILKIAPEIAKRIKYKSVILTNKEYNEKYTKELNMNKIKAILHYYEYIKDQDAVQRGITFLTKAEDKNNAVACASIISRYLFLREFDKLCDEIHIPLPKGAGKDVDTIGEEVVEKYGEEKLKDIAKVNFKNTDRILHTMIY